MSLSSELIAKFVKITKDKPKTEKDTIVYGTTVKDTDGSVKVRIDGSSALIPMESTCDLSLLNRNGDGTDDGTGARVIILIKNHRATVIGNLSNPAVRVETIDGLVVDLKKIDTIIADNITINETLTAYEGRFENLETNSLTVNNILSASVGRITSLEANMITAEQISSTYATIENLNSVNTYIYTLEATYGEFKDLTTDKLTAINGIIEKLDTTYADINFVNITEAAIENIFAGTGIIKDLTIDKGTVTGELTSVTINGDLINANTLKADRLIIRGADGLYYRLNAGVDGVTETQLATEEYQNKLHGDNIIAKTITATQISVSDLHAFDATLGGFNLTENSLYSGVKDTFDNSTNGIFMSKDGKIFIGGLSEYIKYNGSALSIAVSDLTLNTKSLNVLLDNAARTSTDHLSVNNDGLVIGNFTGSLSKIYTTSNKNIETSQHGLGGALGLATTVTISRNDYSNAVITVEYIINSTVADTKTYHLSALERTDHYGRDSVANVVTEFKIPSYGNYPSTSIFIVYDTEQSYTLPITEFPSTGIYLGKSYTDVILESGNWATMVTDVVSIQGMLGNNVLIDSDSVDIRYNNQVRASFGEDCLYLAKHSRNAKIDMCDGLVTMYHESKYSYDTIFVIDTGNTTEVMGLINPLCVTSVDDLDQVSIQFANANGVMGGIGIIGSWLRRFGKNMFDTYTVLDSGNFHDVMDSGWFYTGGYGDNFSQYNNETHSKVRYRKIGKVVEVRGVMKPTVIIPGSTTQYEMFTLPEGYRPDCIIYQRCQGSGANMWLLIVRPDGIVTFSRYGSDSDYAEANSSTWLPFQITFFVD